MRNSNLFFKYLFTLISLCFFLLLSSCSHGANKTVPGEVKENHPQISESEKKAISNNIEVAILRELQSKNSSSRDEIDYERKPKAATKFLKKSKKKIVLTVAPAKKCKGNKASCSPLSADKRRGKKKNVL